jgi:hypothetical protein
VATIGPALFIASRFAISFLLQSAREHLPSFVQSPDKATVAERRTDEKTAVDLLDFEGLLRDCDKRLILDDPRERLPPNERHLYLKVARLIAGGVVRNYRDAAAAERDAADSVFEQDAVDQVSEQDAANKAAEPIATRNQHAKTHGCVHAYFIVDDRLPVELAVGVFRPGERYDAILRFSNAHETPQADCKGDGRGMAIKLQPADGQGEQDFVLVNHPVFFVDDVAEYARFMKIVHSRASTFMIILRVVLFFVPWRLRKGLILLRLKFIRIGNPFNASYFSMSPFALGEQVVRYVVTPAGNAPAGTSPDDRPNFLRERMAERLGDDETEASDSAVAFNFSVQIRDQPTPADVEHASRAWRRAADRTVRLARIEISPQTFATADQLCSCENLRFSPWHARPEHRPLGGINRIRLLVYLASSRMRRRLNMVDSP